VEKANATYDIMIGKRRNTIENKLRSERKIKYNPSNKNKISITHI
jgi:hypothetical protein